MPLETSRNWVAFDRFRFDFTTGRLQKNGVRLKLAAQPAQILALLLEHPGELVTRDQIRARLWGETLFSDSEHNLNVAVAKLRDVLGDSAENPSLIATVPRQGYRFVCPVAGPEAMPGAAAAVPVQEHAPPSAPTTLDVSNSRANHRRWQWVAIAITVILTGPGIAYYFVQRASPAIPKVRLAVLPFENLSQDPEQEYFSEGLTEEMIARLGRIRPDRLSVIARASVVRYKTSTRSVREIGRELGVDYILEGSVRSSGGRLRITAKLIQVPDEGQLWSETFDRDSGDWIDIQAQVAQRVGRGVQVTLSSQAPLKFGSLLNAGAHEEYLRGRYQWNKRNKPGLTKAIEHFQRAIEIEPSYANAYAGLADSYLLMSNYAPGEETLPRAEAAARRALKIDPGLAEAYASLGLAAMNDRWAWQDSEDAYRRAIELDPNYATAHHWYAENLCARGRFDEALREIAVARELDPLSLIIATDTGKILGYARRYVESIVWLRKVLAEDPGFGEAHFYLVQAYANSGRLKEALDDLDAYRDPDRADWFDDLRGSILVKMGRTGEARMLAQAIVHKTGFQGGAYRTDVALGKRDAVFENFEVGFLHRTLPTNLKVDPALDPLRGDARFTAILKRMGF